MNRPLWVTYLGPVPSTLISKIKDEAARMKVTPPLVVAPLAHGCDMRWNPNDDGINFNP